MTTPWQQVVTHQPAGSGSGRHQGADHGPLGSHASGQHDVRRHRGRGEEQQREGLRHLVEPVEVQLEGGRRGLLGLRGHVPRPRAPHRPGDRIGCVDGPTRMGQPDEHLGVGVAVPATERALRREDHGEGVRVLEHGLPVARRPEVLRGDHDAAHRHSVPPGPGVDAEGVTGCEAEGAGRMGLDEHPRRVAGPQVAASVSSTSLTAGAGRPAVPTPDRAAWCHRSAWGTSSCVRTTTGAAPAAEAASATRAGSPPAPTKSAKRSRS